MDLVTADDPSRVDEVGVPARGSPAAGRCAVVYNPTKISEQFRDLVEKVVQRGGWADTLWLETSVDDPGRSDDSKGGVRTR